MTYPTDPNDAIDADGAFEIGGGFGQDYEEDGIRALFRVPAPTAGTALDLFRGNLLKVPLEGLKSFRDMLPGATDDDFVDSTSAVNKIMDSLLGNPLHVRFEEWQDWLDTAWDNSMDWLSRLIEDILILLDVFHINHTGAEWSAAWADLMVLFGLAKSVSTPTYTEPAIGTAITTAQADATAAGSDANTANTSLGTMWDNMVNTLLGRNETGMTNSDARDALATLLESTIQNAKAIKDLQSDAVNGRYAGQKVTIDFADYADGPLPSDFTVTYSGSGTSTVGVKDGKSCWNSLVNDANRSALIQYNVAPTDTDYQIVRGTMGSPPQSPASGGTPRIWALSRMNAAGDSFVWARGYATGWLTYRGDIGCTIAGVETVWASNIPLTWSLDIYLVSGVGADPRQHEVYSGSTLVYRTPPGTDTTSMMGSSYRYWGALSEMKTGAFGAVGPGTIAASSVVDNQPPDVVGPTAHMYRTSTTAVSYPNSWTALPSSFWQVKLRESPDITADLTNGTFTVTKAGSYIINASLRVSVSISSTAKLGLQVNGSLTQSRVMTNNVSADGCLCATWTEYLVPGDVVRLATTRGGATANILVGEATGTETYFNITSANLSFM